MALAFRSAPDNILVPVPAAVAPGLGSDYQDHKLPIQQEASLVSP